MKRLLVMGLFATSCAANGPPVAAMIPTSSVPPQKEPTAPEDLCENGFAEVVTNGRTERYVLEKVVEREEQIVLGFGPVSLAIMRFREPTTLPAIYEHARVEHGPIRFDSRVELTSWGDVGEWVEGTFWNGRFRVCRTADWHASKK